MTLDGAALYRLLAWSSPGYPTGAFSYSHGLEWAVEAGQVRGRDELLEFVETVLSRGGGWIDAVLFAQVWRAAPRMEELLELNRLAAAFRGSAETALESRQQGSAFLQVTRRAWPHPLLDAFAARVIDESLEANHAHSGEVAHCVVAALASAAHKVPLTPSLDAYLHAFAANLVSAGARLIPLGQTDAQIAIARLADPIHRIGALARKTPLDDLGTSAPGLELCSLLHETQYTRLFRS